MIPDYIELRNRRPVPASASVVPGSTPVIAFGDPASSRVATLGLNPSRLEFLTRSGQLLTLERRFETLEALGISSLTAASDEAVVRVWEGCRQYFARNQYRRWFDQLEAVLRSVDASYYERSACHLDLVQWATDPTWGSLGDDAIGRMLLEAVPFLQAQLRASSIEMIPLNGRRVMTEFERAFGPVLRPHGHPLIVGRVGAVFSALDLETGGRVGTGHKSAATRAQHTHCCAPAGITNSGLVPHRAPRRSGSATTDRFM